MTTAAVVYTHRPLNGGERGEQSGVGGKSDEALLKAASHIRLSSEIKEAYTKVY